MWSPMSSPYPFGPHGNSPNKEMSTKTNMTSHPEGHHPLWETWASLSLLELIFGVPSYFLQSPPTLYWYLYYVITRYLLGIYHQRQWLQSTSSDDRNIVISSGLLRLTPGRIGLDDSYSTKYPLGVIGSNGRLQIIWRNISSMDNLCYLGELWLLTLNYFGPYP